MSVDCFPYMNRRRRHVRDLPNNFEYLKRQVDILCARWKDVDEDINHQSATIQKNHNYAACLQMLERMLTDYQIIVNRYKKLVRLESDANGAAGDQTPVHELSAVSKGWKNKFCIPTFYKLARLDKDVLNLTIEVSQLENKITLEHVTRPKKPAIVVTQSAKELTHVTSHQAVLDSLVHCLHEAGCKRIAIYGEPQAGKTNILKNLNNLLVQCPPALELNYAIWVTFPTHLPELEDIITAIQEKILQHLSLTVQNCGSAAKVLISRALSEKSYLLLFDGFSSSIALEDIGISQEHKHGKVIIEAKYPHLLWNFQFDKVIKLERLPHQDSRKLFDKIIDDETFCEQNTVLADLIVKELGGLPGVITFVAGQLKNKKVQYWEGVRQRLTADIWDDTHLGLAGVKFAFDTAYSKLKENDRKCLLYAALFPKEFTIPIDILVECWKAEEFLWCPIPTFSHARREGECVLEQLIELNLLEKCSEHHVKMPIIYRRFALKMPFPGEENATSFVRSGPEIDGHLKDEEWEMARRVSLMRSRLMELPVSPKCEGISTLFLQLNPNLRIIEEPFFRRMQHLRVLDLHNTGIELLPPSISYLTSLRSLYLNNCCALAALPPEIVILKQLEVLDIRGTSIHYLPKEISGLVGLRCLRFSFVLEACNPTLEPERTWLIFSPGTADQLNDLEELTIVLVNGTSDDIYDQIEAEVPKFKNRNNQFKLIPPRLSQSLDQGNLVQPRGEGINLQNPSVTASHVRDPTTGNQSPRSDNKLINYKKGSPKISESQSCMETVSGKAKDKSTKQEKKREMVNVVQKLYQTCKEVFADGDHRIPGYIPPPPDIERLKSILDSMKPEDLNLTPNMPIFRRSSKAQEAPPQITYIHLYECDQFSIGIFCVPPSGVIPLHNHPNMTVLSKLLFGSLRIKSYDWVDDGTSSTSKTYTDEITNKQHGIRLAKVHMDSDVTSPYSTSVLFPAAGGNMHCFTALTACAILDVLGPPYSESQGRPCTYFQDFPYDKFSGDEEEVLPEEEHRKNHAWLQETEKPEDFIVVGALTYGPTIVADS